MSKKINYQKESPRITVKYIDGDTNELIFEIPNRTCLDIGDVMNDVNVSEMMRKQNATPSLVRVLTVVDFYKTERKTHSSRSVGGM